MERKRIMMGMIGFMMVFGMTALGELLPNEDADGDGMPNGWEVDHGLNPLSGVSSNLVAWYRFDEGSGGGNQQFDVRKLHGGFAGGHGRIYELGGRPFRRNQ